MSITCFTVAIDSNRADDFETEIFDKYCNHLAGTYVARNEPGYPRPAPIPSPTTTVLVRHMYDRDAELDVMDCLSQIMDQTADVLDDGERARVAAWFNARYGA